MQSPSASPCAADVPALEAPPPPPLLNDECLAMMRRGVSVIVSACGPDLTPSLMRAVGSRVSPSGDRITVFLNRAQSAQVLRDLASTGHIAVVFSEPFSHRTVQVKARRVRLREATAHDQPALDRYGVAMRHELDRIGFPADFAAAMLAHRLDDLTAVEFTPEQAFNQTPGPLAGQRMPGTP